MVIKQVIIIRKDLNMRKGKMIAQGAHASLKVFLDKLSPMVKEMKGDKITNYYLLNITKEMEKWIKGDFRKIVLYVESEQELLDIYEQAIDTELPCALIQDNGLTEFNGKKTYTAVAIGPAPDTDIDKITKDLPLL